MKDQIKITAVIMTYNEDKRIRACLESVANVADEILVIDSFSTDKTEDICREFNTTFTTHTFEGYTEQREYGLQTSSSNYVIQIDADETLSDKLIASILETKQNWDADAYYMNRMTNYAGKWIRHCGWYPDKRIRLFDKTKIRIAGKNPHDRVDVAEGSKAKWIAGDILHFSYSSISNHVEKTNAFSLIEARSAHERGERVSVFYHILVKPSYQFFHQYVIKRGFLDGYMGFVICAISAFGKFLKYVKLRDINNTSWK